MGADALIEDPSKRSTSVGVTVNPVRVQNIKDFGTLDDVGQKLMQAEQKKVRCRDPFESLCKSIWLYLYLLHTFLTPLSFQATELNESNSCCSSSVTDPARRPTVVQESTMDVRMISQDTRAGSDDSLLYDFEYELDSTRGRKRILNTVTIYKSKLYILNGNLKCSKEGCGDDNQAGIAVLRQVAGSFDVLS